MDKEKALELLQEYIDKRLLLPKVDAQIKYCRWKTVDELDCSFNYDYDEGVIWEDYTFKHLLCIAYNLKPIEDENTL